MVSADKRRQEVKVEIKAQERGVCRQACAIAGAFLLVELFELELQLEWK